MTKITPHRDGFKKYVGGRRFYSHAGQDRESFRLVAAALVDRWDAIKRQGGEWTEEDINAAYDAAGVPRWPNAHPTPAQTAPSASNVGEHSGTLHAQIDLYLVSLKATMEAGEISYDEYEKQHQHLTRIKKLVGDVAISSIQYDELIGLKHRILKSKKLDGTDYAVDTLKTVLYCVKRFFGYLDESGRWPSPRRYEKALRVNWTKLGADEDGDSDNHEYDVYEKSEEEQDLNAGEDETFSVTELAYFWKIGTSLGRLILGLALFAGFTASDFASLRKHQVIDKGVDLFIRRKRWKTRHSQKYPTTWWIPPEVANLLRQEVLRTPNDSHRNPKGLAVLTSNMLPLVHRPSGGGRKTDNVALIWRAMLKKGVTNKKARWMGHKHLRKTGGRLIRYGVGDWKGDRLEIAQRFLAHSVKTVAEKHYLGRPQFKPLHDAQRELYRHLGPLVFQPQASDLAMASERVA
jgi:hypothetical protein